MTEAECVAELLAKGWTQGQTGQLFRSDSRWWIGDAMADRKKPLGVFCGGLWLANAATLPELLACTMDGSAGITVATYFGLRNPGGG